MNKHRRSTSFQAIENMLEPRLLLSAAAETSGIHTQETTLASSSILNKEQTQSVGRGQGRSRNQPDWDAFKTSVAQNRHPGNLLAFEFKAKSTMGTPARLALEIANRRQIVHGAANRRISGDSPVVSNGHDTGVSQNTAGTEGSGDRMPSLTRKARPQSAARVVGTRIRAMRLAPSNEVNARRGDSPLFTSGGGDTTPVLKYDGVAYTTTIPDVVGGAAEVSVSAPAGKTISSITWTFPVNVFKSQKAPTVSDGGFINYPLLPADLDDATVPFFWGPSGGGDIKVSVTYNEGGVGEKTVHVALATPTIQTNVAYGSAVAIHDVPKTGGGTIPALIYGNPLGTPLSFGVAWKLVLLDDKGYGGTLKTVQIMHDPIFERTTQQFILGSFAGSYRYQTFVYRNASGQLVMPSSLLDDGKSGAVFYEPPGLLPTAVSDSPNIPFDSSDLRTGESIDQVTMRASFVDTVMYQPSGGIWVPLGGWTWSVNATANLSATPPVVNNLTSPGPGAGPYGAGTWPSWTDYTDHLRNWVDTTP